MDTEIKLVFHDKGLRSYIEVDLCAHCPRQDDKGCCGYYSPVFYPLDLYYLLQNAPHMLQHIWDLPHLTILDHSVTVNAFPDEHGGYDCQFHCRESGCRLHQEWRESICRHFVCPGIGWQNEESLAAWKDFFIALEKYEIKLNQAIADHLAARGLSLRNAEQRLDWMTELTQALPQLQNQLGPIGSSSPATNSVIIRRELKYRQDWPL